MEDALYGPLGYYGAGAARTGAGGDYFTAPETGAAFAQLLTAIFTAWRARLAADPFSLVEVGGGEGRLADALMGSWSADYTVVERSAARREKIKTANPSLRLVDDIARINPPATGIIFANELIDAFPVHRVRMMHGLLKEGYIQMASRIPTLEWNAPSTPQLAAYFERLKITLPDGYETEVNLAMADWLRRASGALDRGILLVIDYGRPAWDYYAEERTRGTLRGFKNHRVLDVPELLREGRAADWTADVDFTSLALDAQNAGFEPLAFMEMGAFLKMGLTPALATDQPAFKPALRYLLHPEGLGAQFHVLILGKNIDAAAWIFEHNRLARLGLDALGTQA